jgi:hypothetical protein
MGARNKKKLKRLNLLEMPNHKRNQLIKEIREKLQRKTMEAKLWQSLLEVENLTINGNTICIEDETLAGLSFRR